MALRFFPRAYLLSLRSKFFWVFHRTTKRTVKIFGDRSIARLDQLQSPSCYLSYSVTFVLCLVQFEHSC